MQVSIRMDNLWRMPFLADRTKYPLIPTSVYGKKYPKGYEKAIETISVEMILEKVEQILNVL